MLGFNKALDDLQLSGIRQITALAKQTPGCILLTLGEPDFNTAEPVKAQVTQELSCNETHYPPNNGKEFLKVALSEHMQTRGATYASDEIIVTCGATEALCASLTCILNPGDEVIIPTPAFGLYESIVTLNQARPVLLDTSDAGFQLSLDALRNAASERTKAIVITSPNNPTGCILNAESLAAVAQFVTEQDVFVICDDVYGRLVYEDGYASFAQTYPQLRDRTIICDSFSKPYAMTGWRLGWVAADASIIAQISKVHQYMVSSVPSFVQTAAVEALAQDISPMVETYAERRRVVVGRLAAMGLDVVNPQGAFYAFPSVAKFGLSSDEFCRRLIKEAGVALVPGSCFGAVGYVRLSYCCAMEDIIEGLNRLEAFIKGL